MRRRHVGRIVSGRPGSRTRWARWLLALATTCTALGGAAEATVQPPVPEAGRLSTTTGPMGRALPGCTSGEVPARHRAYADWRRTLVDPRYSLSSRYAPPDLTTVRRAGFDSDERVRSFVIPHLRTLRRSASAAGHPIEVLSGFRDYAEQAALFSAEAARVGPAAAAETVAAPGHSEHQLGTTIDVAGPGTRTLTPAWGSTPTGHWMAANAWRFGFVMSYPKGNRSASCYAYEPWHYRYVGGIAERIHRDGVTLRALLWSNLSSATRRGSGCCRSR